MVWTGKKNLLTNFFRLRFGFACVMFRLVSWDVRYDEKKIKDVMLHILLTGLRLTLFPFACLMLRLVSWDVRCDEKKNRCDVTNFTYGFFRIAAILLNLGFNAF